MRRATMVRPGQIEFSDVARPEVGPGQVLIQIRACGVCGSDVHVWNGTHAFVRYPVVQGHEFAGLVEAVGPGSEHLHVSQKVTVVPSIACGTCRLCRAGRMNICETLKVMGYGIEGAHQDYLVASAEKVVAVPDHVSFDEATLIEPLAVAVHALRQGGVQAGDNILIFGAGTIGHVIMQAAKAKGARVAIADVNDFRLRLAEKHGADIVINPLRDTVADKITPFAERGHITFECAGREATIGQALSLAPRGGRVVVLGLFGQLPKVDMGLLPHSELEVIGSLMYWVPDFHEAVRLLESPHIDLGALITARFGFEDLAGAYTYAAETRTDSMKAVVLY